MGKIWLTSDLHFCHNKDFLYEPRGFTSIEEHDATVVKNWNSVVAADDVVYCLGDCMLNNNEKGLELMKQLNGNIYVAIGNHDTNTRIELYKTLPNIKDITYGYRIRYKKKELILTHYQTIVANFEEKKPVYNLHGHTHSKDKFCEYPHCYNVALDAHNNTPILLDDIIKEIKNESSNNV